METTKKTKKAGPSEPVKVKAEVMAQPLPGDPTGFMTMALEKGSDMQTLERLEQMMERYTQRLAKRDYTTSLSLFQASCPVIKKDKSTTFKTSDGQVISYSWASLGQIDREIKDLLTRYGLAKNFKIKQADGTVTVTCIISHANGHTEETTMSGPVDNSGKKNLIQQNGSSVTYLMRYSLIGALGLTTTDNDPDGKRAKEPNGNGPDITEATVVVDKTKTDKPLDVMDDALFKQTLQSISEGKVKIKELAKHYKMTADQIATLRGARYQKCLILVSKGEMTIDAVQKEIKLDEKELAALNAIAPAKK